MDLTGKVIALQGLKRPVDICVIPEKNIFLVLDIHTPYYVHVYDLKNFTLIKSFIKKGIGVNEQLDCHRMTYDKDKNILSVLDLQKNKVFFYDVNSIANQKLLTIPDSDINIRVNLKSMPLVIDSVVVDFRMNEKGKPLHKLDYYTTKGKYLNSKGDYPTEASHFTFPEMKCAFESSLTLSQDKKYIISSYYHTDFIDLFDLQGNLLCRKQGPLWFKPEIATEQVMGGYSTHPTADNRRAYAFPKMNENNLYVLFCGKKMKARDFHSTMLFNFDEKLNPKKLMELDVPIYTFDIDWKTRHLLGLSDKLPQLGIVEYQL